MSESVTRSVFADSVGSALKSVYSAEEESAENVFIKERDASIKASEDRVKKMREEAEKLAAQERARAEAAAAREATRLASQRAARDRFWVTRSRNMQQERDEYLASRASYAASAEFRRQNRELARSTALAGARTRLQSRFLDADKIMKSANESIQRARDADRDARDALSDARKAQLDLQDPGLTPEAKKTLQNRMAKAFSFASSSVIKKRRARREALKKQQEAAKARQKAEQEARELAAQKENCNNLSWENVYVGGRVGRDISFAGKTNFNTGGQTITKGNTKLTYSGGKTSVSRLVMVGRGYRGVPIMQWRSKQTYDGLVKVVGDRVGYNKLEKLPKKQQPYLCKMGSASACRYKPGNFVELHDFNDTGKKYMPMFHNGHVGVMQGDTGKFFSLAENKVIDNPYTSDCQTNLGFK